MSVELPLSTEIPEENLPADVAEALENFRVEFKRNNCLTGVSGGYAFCVPFYINASHTYFVFKFGVQDECTSNRTHVLNRMDNKTHEVKELDLLFEEHD